MGTLGNLAQNRARESTEARVSDPGSVRRHISRPNPLLGAYVALLLFMVIYCARPEDWVPGLSGAPLAKIAGIIALLALIVSLTQVKWPLPREAVYMVVLTGQLFAAVLLSPVWSGGALQKTLDFTKVTIIVIVMAATVTSAKRLRRLIFVQAASAGAIAAITVWKGHLNGGRLEGLLQGNYSNSNELALAIVISLPLCLALLLLNRRWFWKAVWAIAVLVMIYAVLLTGSRGGFISLVVSGAVCLWGLAIRGRRNYLLAFAALAGVILWQSASGMLVARLNGTFDPERNTASAYGSAQQRQGLFWRSVEVTREHPLFGVGPGNFVVISGNWHDTHNSFTQMSSEGGVPALVFYVLIIWSGFKNATKVHRLSRRGRDIRLLAWAVEASLAGYTVGALFDSTAYQFFPYILVAYTTALSCIAKQSSSYSREYKSSLVPLVEVGSVSAEDGLESGRAQKDPRTSLWLTVSQ